MEMKSETIKVELTLTESMLGTVPKNKEIYKDFVGTKAPKEENAEEEVSTLVEIEEKGWTGFHQDEKGVFIYDYMIRGFLKNAANVLKDQIGIKAARSKIDCFVFVFPRRIHFKRDGSHVKTVDGINERSIRVQTPMGPRVALVRSDFISENTTLEFEITVIGNSKEITKELIISLFEYGKYCGLGQFRNGSYGRFEVSIT